MTDNDKMIDNNMMKIKGGQGKCQINNTVVMMCEDPRVKQITPWQTLTKERKDKKMLQKK